MVNQRRHKNYSLNNHQRGATAVIVAVVLIILIGVGALAVDLGFAYFQRTNLQKAVDASALAGARVLYRNDGKKIMITDALKDAEDIVHLNINGVDTEDLIMEVGHWAFGTQDNDGKRFVPYNAWSQNWDGEADVEINPLVDIKDYIGDDLDGVTDHINAVRVSATLQSPSFFSKIWGSESLNVSAEAVAYLGFAGTTDKFEVDLPIAICSHSIIAGQCTIGKIVPDTVESAMWTDFEECNFGIDDPMNTAKNKGVTDAVPNDCRIDEFESKIGYEIFDGQGIRTRSGFTAPIYDAIHTCWDEYTSDNIQDENNMPLSVVLPVIDCVTSNCNKVIGVTAINIIWIHEPGGTDSKYENIPRAMSVKIDETNTLFYACSECYQHGTDGSGKIKDPEDMWNNVGDFIGGDWICGDKTDGQETLRQNCWDDFINTFSLLDSDGNPPAYDKQALYFLPDCYTDIPTGGSGGMNFGLMAKIPVLVK